MTVLTIYVLVGDDIRLLCFEKRSDPIFNGFTIFCLVLFSVELTISCMTKKDYFLGFWFVLDVVATFSLIFDLTYVSEAMMDYPEISVDHLESPQHQGAVGQSEYARASRSSRVGTRVARLLRVARFIRMSRILDCINGCLRKCGLRVGAGVVQPGAEARCGDEEGMESGAESRVGKKLSEKTTQRVIVLVLIMLFVSPQLRPKRTELMLPSSAEYGADVVYQAWEDYERGSQQHKGGEAPIVSPVELQKLRRRWEIEVLTYIYYHNWHADSDYVVRLCWIGYIVNTKAFVSDALDNTQEGYVQMLRPETTDWEMLLPNYAGGALPDVIKGALARPWTTDCSEQSPIYGVSLLSDKPCPRSVLRKQETMWFIPRIAKRDFFMRSLQGQFVFVFDARERVGWESVMSILQTVFVIVVLSIGALVFSRDADNLVLFPIERMISKVDLIRKDPLYAIRLADEKLKMEVATSAGRTNATAPDHGGVLCARRRAARRSSRLRKLGRRGRQPMNPYKKDTLETHILENAIIKLGSLLALGFGEAGSETIGQNMDDETATVNAMIPGCKVDAIYGFCDIRNFATATEVLKENTMVFVNQVAEIVHCTVDEHLGAANKNVGEAFLLVWRIGLYEQEQRSKIADLAVMSFVKVVAGLSRDRQLAEYCEHPALLARLPNFRVSLGFGLHLGWSIEGAIGSEFKIDASYLSPHVNIASRLEAATTEYGVSILMSEPLVRCCEPSFRKHFRPIDHVKLQGSKSPMRLFTVDLNHEVLRVQPPVQQVLLSNEHLLGSRAENRRKSEYVAMKKRQDREYMKVKKLSRSFQVAKEWDNDKNVKRMRDRFFPRFFQEFEKGYMNYEAGEWDVAENVLQNTRSMLFRDGSNNLEDGPSCTLLKFMRQSHCRAPPGWPGYRELRER